MRPVMAQGIPSPHDAHTHLEHAQLQHKQLFRTCAVGGPGQWWRVGVAIGSVIEWG